MTVLAQPAVEGETVPAGADLILTTEVLAHLEIQLQSARRLLAIVLEQGVAIRARNVHEVVSCAGTMQAELSRRGVIERERARLLSQAGVRLGIDPGAVTVELLCGLMDPESAADARRLSSELRGMLAEVAQEHRTNRALMQQELSFLDHLLRLADVDGVTGYDAGGDHNRRAGARLRKGYRVLDLEV